MDKNLPKDINVTDDSKSDGGVLQPNLGSITTLSSGESAPIFERKVETISSDLEKEKTIEVPTPKSLGEIDNQTKEQEEINQVGKTSDEMNVVDKRTNNEKLDDVGDQSKQKLTKKADDEEEDFIKHVEEVHSIK